MRQRRKQRPKAKRKESFIGKSAKQREKKETLPHKKTPHKHIENPIQLIKKGYSEKKNRHTYITIWKTPS